MDNPFCSATTKRVSKSRRGSKLLSARLVLSSGLGITKLRGPPGATAACWLTRRRDDFHRRACWCLADVLGARVLPPPVRNCPDIVLTVTLESPCHIQGYTGRERGKIIRSILIMRGIPQGWRLRGALSGGRSSEKVLIQLRVRQSVNVRGFKLLLGQSHECLE
jgi:hypothetical protein